MRKKFIWIVFFLTGVAFGWALFFLTSNSDPEISEVRSGGYAYINPLLECEVDGGLEDKDLRPFKSSIEKIIQKAVTDQKLDEVSVYYRDLNNGPWFGIDEEALFAPQSLLKVPVLIAYLHKAETNPSVLEEKIVFNLTDQRSSNPNIKERLIVGEEYFVDVLLHRMIEFSDNDAFYLLLMHIGSQEVNAVHVALGLQTFSQDTTEDFVTVKAYASLFRILYNSSYLNREMSEYALKILSSSNYEKGLTALLPSDVVVAHKFGIKTVEGTLQDQLHDCGIIYKFNNPYLLCVMTKGKNLESIEQVIQDISLAVYEKR